MSLFKQSESIAECLCDRNHSHSELTIQIVEQYLFAHFHAGTPTIETTALYFKIDIAKLEDIFLRESSSFKQLQDEITKKIAADLIKRNELSIILVSMVLGFPCYNNFKEKFQLWYNIFCRHFWSVRK